MRHGECVRASSLVGKGSAQRDKEEISYPPAHLHDNRGKPTDQNTKTVLGATGFRLTVM